jgi:RimJ/RimL family protein N-acetyltransferase
MPWTITESLDAFTSEAGDFLDRRPVENNVLRSICGTLRRRGPDTYGPQPPRFGWWRSAGGAEVAAAFLCTPPYPPLLARGDARAVRELAAEEAAAPNDPLTGGAAGALTGPLAGGPTSSSAGPLTGRPAGVLTGPLSGVRGDAQAVRVFCAAWRERTGARMRIERRLRFWELDTLTPRTPAPPGRARVAGPADRALLLAWQETYAREVGEPVPGAGRLLDDALGYGGRTLWEVDGEPVAMAGHTSPADGVVRIVGVYTPAGLRGRGYAGTVTAAVSQAVLDGGARQVALATDLANPVSNHLYQRIGYVPVCDQLSVAFTGAVA